MTKQSVEGVIYVPPIKLCFQFLLIYRYPNTVGLPFPSINTFVELTLPGICSKKPIKSNINTNIYQSPKVPP